MQQILDTRQQQIGLEGFGDVGIGTALVAFHLVTVQGTGREQDDGNV